MTKRATSANAATRRTAKHGASRLLVYIPPWLVWILVLPLAGGAHVLWGTDPTAAPWMSMASFALVCTLVWFTWKVLRPRGEMLQWLGTVSTGLAGLWFIVGMLVSPLTRGVVDAWGFGGFGICLFWTIRRAVLTGALEQGAEVAQSKFEKVLAGAKVRRPREIDGRVVAEVEVNRGEQTVKDLQGVRDHMAGSLGVRPNAVRITPSGKDAGMAEMVVVPTDPLVGEIVWPGPSAPGRSIADYPVAIGDYEDGEVADIWLVGDDAAGRAAAHWLVMGMNGAGKSQGWVVAMADALTRCDFELWGSDHVKGKQTFGPLLRYMSRVATTKLEAKALISDARTETARRQADFGERGIKQWEKGCGYTLLMVWIEEASEIVDDSPSFVRLVERARSAGVLLVVSLQRASHDNIDTSARAQLAGSLCFGVRDAMDATFALPDAVLDAGAAPDAWGNRKPGYAYVVGPGIEEDRWPVPLRTYRGRDPELAAALERWARPVSDNATNILVENGLEGEVVDQVDIDTDDGEEGMEPIPPTLEPELNVDPDQPIDPPPADANLVFDRPASGPKLSTEQARAVVQQHLRTLVSVGRTQTQPADVCAMKPETTRTREWVRKELQRLCAEPGPGEIRLERDDADMPGVYRIVTPVLAGV